MAIIQYTRDNSEKYLSLSVFPDQFKSAKQKQNDTYVKNTMDFFANKAYLEYQKNKKGFVKNYDLLKGVLHPEDFYQEPQVKSFTDMLTADVALPSYVKMYSIMTTPVNELIGELSKRADDYRSKAFDSESQAEELSYKTEILHEYIMQQAKAKIMEKARMQGEEIEEEELEKRTLSEVQDDITDYTSIAEKWANHVLAAQKAEFKMKEKSEDGYRDLLITAHEYFHLYEDNSKVGFNVKLENPKNAWKLTTPDKKYTSDNSGRGEGAYASGTIHVMELSEIIESVPDLTKEEIDHLRTTQQNEGLIGGREGNIGRDVGTGTDTIVYDTYDPLVEQERMMVAGDIAENADDMSDFLGKGPSISSAGLKFTVIRAYWLSKKKIGKLEFLDESGVPQSMLVDELYKAGTVPNEISITWGWINQWYQGIKVGQDIYHIKPFKLLNYNPIISISYENKNTEAKSLVDLMKPFQVIYNVCINQMYKLLEKEIGKVQLMSIRHIPIPKDGDAQDALDAWEMEARNRGVVFIDDSPENLKSPSSFNQFRDIDMTRTQEIQSRYNLAQQIKAECWELVGLSRQRLGTISASESATGVNSAIEQSYSQTEPIFVAHEALLGQVYQAIVDASLYIESSKPESTISYINSEGTSSFVKVNGTDLKLRDLKVYMTNHPEDVEMFKQVKSLAQPLMQNGGSMSNVIEMYTAKSIREMKKVFKTLEEKQDAMQQQAQALEEQKLQQQQEAQQAQIESMEMIESQRLENENYQKELDRISKEKIAIISATGFGNVESEDVNNNGLPDVLEMSRLELDQNKAQKDYEAKMATVASQAKQASQKLQLEKEKLQVDRENQVNDLQIAKENAKGRAKKASK